MGGVPALLEDFVNSFVDLQQWNSEYVCGSGEYIHYPRPPRVSVHDVARNIAAEEMRGEWLLMLDTDHSFAPDLLGRLLNIHRLTGAKVVTGIYQFKTPPYSPVIYKFRDGGEDGKGGGLHPIGDWDPSTLALNVDSAGAGCLWVEREVFDRIRSELKEQPFDRIQGYGEDHSFFLRLRKLKIEAVCAHRVECKHLQVRALTLDDYARGDVELAEREVMGGYRQ